MANAAPEEPSMEEILSSIRKIVSRGENEAEPDVDEPRTESAPRRRAEDHESAMVEVSEEFSAPAQSEPGNSVQQPSAEASRPAPRQGESLADLARRVREQMPRTGFQTPMSRKPFSPGPEVVKDQSQPAAAAKEREDAGQEAVEVETASELTGNTAPSEETTERVRHEVASVAPSLAVKPEPMQVPGEEEAFRDALVAPATQAAVSGSIERLKRSAMDDTQAQVEAILRPMLREWLDENLPQLVERVVRDEIERIAKTQPK